MGENKLLEIRTDFGKYDRAETDFGPLSSEEIDCLFIFGRKNSTTAIDINKYILLSVAAWCLNMNGFSKHIPTLHRHCWLCPNRQQMIYVYRIFLIYVYRYFKYIIYVLFYLELLRWGGGVAELNTFFFTQIRFLC